MLGIFFGEFQCLPVDDSSAVSCDSGVLARRSESMSFYSAIFPNIILKMFHMSIFMFMKIVHILSIESLQK